jgi:hypothetical protein
MSVAQPATAREAVQLLKARFRGILDVDVYAEGSHFVGHNDSWRNHTE